MMPENAPAHLLRAQFEELEHRKLYEVYSSKGICAESTSAGNWKRPASTAFDFRWLLEDRAAPAHSTLTRFRTACLYRLVQV